MATRQKNTGHHPDTKRDFETGTVNPGPGMAGPLGSDKQHPDANQGGNQAQKDQSKQAQKAKQSDQGCCGCG